MEYNTGLESIDNFNWYYKKLFTWNVKYYSKGNRIVYFGEKIDKPKFIVVLKKIKVDKNYDHILREIYFLTCCKKCKYFITLVDIFLSEDENYIFLILKDEGANLSELIDYSNSGKKNYDYTKIDNMIKWIIFQIVCGLYILHKNNLVHHDIKPGNILISSTGVVKIADFGSVDKSSIPGNGTLFYESPEGLINKNSTEKDDMWAVGVIMVELFTKKYPFFNYKNFCNNNEIRILFQLKAILSQYWININNEQIDINNNNVIYNILANIIKPKAYNQYNILEKLINIDEIEDKEAVDLINNLLKINPEKRFNAEQALNSKYLSKYRQHFQDCRILYEEKDYETLLNSSGNKNIFIRNVKTIKQKFFGEILFE